MITAMISQRMHLDNLVALPHIDAAESAKESPAGAVRSFPCQLTSVEAKHLGHRNWDEVCFILLVTISGIWSQAENRNH